MKYYFGILCVFGILLRYGAFTPWVLEHGLNISLLITEASQTRVGAFAWLDVIVSAVVLFGFIVVEGKRQGMSKLWIPIVGTSVVGVSLGLPLFQLMREIHIERNDRLRVYAMEQ